jgi:amidophosphoribosyltransferase
MWVSCPPIRFPCYYGGLSRPREELLANNRTLRRSRTSSKDSVGYLSLEGMLSCVSLPQDHYCTACWAGRYPIPVDITLNKFCMERYQLYMFEGFTTAHE